MEEPCPGRSEKKARDGNVQKGVCVIHIYIHIYESNMERGTQNHIYLKIIRKDRFLLLIIYLLIKLTVNILSTSIFDCCLLHLASLIN